MLSRVNGTSHKSKKYPSIWLGKAIVPREVFYEWSKNHPDFLKLFKRWRSSNCDQKLTPSVNRIDSNKGYTLDNVEWLTHSINSALAGSVKHNNNKIIKEIYNLIK